MTIPDLLICAGAQKSGTTWLYNRLAEHPETRRASHKELHYFNAVHCGGMLGPQMKMNMMRKLIDNKPQRVIKFIQAQAAGKVPPQDIARYFRPMNDNWYIRFFDQPGKFAMDFTPEYALLPDEGHEHIKRISERQKVMYIMREPLDRALSAVRYFFKTSGRDISTASESEILDVARNPVIKNLSQYDRTVPMLERHYDHENLRFFFYEAMMEDKGSVLNEVCDWLDIERMTLSEAELDRRDNATTPFQLPASVIDELGETLSAVRSNIEAKFPEARGAWMNVLPQ